MKITTFFAVSVAVIWSCATAYAQVPLVPSAAAPLKLPKAVPLTAPPALRSEVWLNDLDQSLHLTAEQKVRIRAIGQREEQQIAFARLRAKSEIRSVLTVEQKKALEDLIKKRQADFVAKRPNRRNPPRSAKNPQAPSAPLP